MINDAYLNYIKNLEKGFIHNPKLFWNYIKSKKIKNSRRSHVMTFKNIPLNSDDDIANSFATFFKSVYVSHDAINDHILDSSLLGTANTFNINNITFDEIRIAIKKLKPKMCSGPDGLPPFILKGCYDALSYPLHIIYNLILKLENFQRNGNLLVYVQYLSLVLM